MTIKMSNSFTEQKVRGISRLLLHCIYISSVSQYKNTSRESIQNCKTAIMFFPITALKLVQNNVKYRNDCCKFVNVGHYNIII